MFPFSISWVQRELQQDGPRMTRTLPWSSDLELGTRELDPEHQRLVGRINALLRALGDHDAHRVNMAYTSLAAAATAHFNGEETLMQRCGYGGTRDHVEQHAELARRLSEVRYSHFSPYGLGHSLGAFPFLERWLVPHLRMSDRRLADHLGRTSV